MSKIPKRALTILLPVLTGVLFIACWYGAHHAMSEERRFLLPAPHAVAEAFATNGPEIARAAVNTLKGAALGFGSAVAGGFALALILSLSPLLRAALYPYLMLVQMTPVIVFAPIFILWIGPGLPSVSVITFIICVFPIVVNTTQGLISTDPLLTDLFRMCRASRWQQLFLLRVPAALPYFFTGLRISATLAPIGAITGDFIAGSSAGDGGGLGFLVVIYGANFKMPALFATAFTGCAVGFLFVGVVMGLSWLALHKWHESYGRADR